VQFDRGVPAAVTEVVCRSPPLVLPPPSAVHHTAPSHPALLSHAHRPPNRRSMPPRGPARDGASLAGCSRSKKAEQARLIPEDWTLPPNYVNQFECEADPKAMLAGCGILSSYELSITEENDGTRLRLAYASGSLTASEMIRASCKRAAVAHQLVSHTNNSTSCLFPMTALTADMGRPTASQRCSSTMRSREQSSLIVTSPRPAS